MRKWRVFALLSLVAMLVLMALPAGASAAGPGDLVITTSYPWVVADKGKPITFSLEANNRGTDYREVELQVADAPANWAPIFKDTSQTVRKVMVAPGKSQYFTFQVQPPSDAKAGDYSFGLKALDSGALASSLNLKVSLQDSVTKGLMATSQISNLRGQAGTSFSFKMDVVNNASEDRSINFAAQAPDGWEITFKPAYDSKQVSSIRVKAGETQGVDIDMAPPRKVEAGDYTVTVTASAGSDRAEVPYKITVLGNYKLELGTASGQLNGKATVDEESTMQLYVRNSGASTVQNVSLSASKPDGWTVTFSPEKVDSIAAGQAVPVTIKMKPGSRTLAGDYMMNVSASALGTGGTSDNKDLRITVDTPTTWGVAGIVLIVAVLGGLGLMFTKLSRR